jgi:glutathionylspermidine synthase
VSYDAFAQSVTEDGTITDPWIDGAPRFRTDPIILTRDEWRALATAAEDVAGVYDEMCGVVSDEPALLEKFFAMTPLQRAMWACSQPLWHGIARADLFFTGDGIACAELNCDTPTGEAESVITGRIARAAHGTLSDPNALLEARFAAMLDQISTRELDRRAETVGLVYPTEFTEDLSVIRLYKRWVEATGRRVVLGSPYNLVREGDDLVLFDERIDLILRHYKTDWWGERVSAWDDEDLADTEPLAEPLGAALECALERRVSIVNPFGSVLPQNKRSMAFMWEHVHRFSPHAQAIIEKYVPVSQRLETMHQEQLRAQKDAWVLKSDYGAEGEEVVVGRATDEPTWIASLAHARTGHWIAQRFFSAKTNATGEITNFGVYLVAGRAAGIYARVQTGPTDSAALSVPVLVES